jgi:isoleucyl-tRNA synthetase
LTGWLTPQQRLCAVCCAVSVLVRFLLGNLSDFNPATDAVPYQQLPAVDRWLLSSHARLMLEVQEAYDTYQVHQPSPWGLGVS